MSIVPRAARPLLAAALLLQPLLARAQVETTRLTILHTNDWHGYAFEEDYKGVPSGGVAACAVEVARLRREIPDRLLVLDAGDLLSGHAAASFEADGVRGLPFVDLWQRIGFDAWAIGNHELDHGRANLAALLERISAPALCGNWLATLPGGGAPVAGRDPAPVEARPFLVLERAGLRVGVVGLVTGDLTDLAAKEALQGTVVAPPAAALAQIWPALDARSDIQIALTHMGVDADRRLAAAFPELEVIVGGHSHKFVRRPLREGKVVIVQAGCYGKVLGRLDLEIRDQQVVSAEGRLLNLPRPADAEIDPELLAAEQTLRGRIEALDAQVIGVVPAPLGRSYHQASPLGNVVAEACRRAAQAEVGFVNSGGLRADLEAGPMTRAELMAMLPFDNELVRFTLTGAELERVCRHNARVSLTEEHGILQVAGLRYSFAPGSGEGEVVVEGIEIGGKALDRNASYLCAGNDYIVTTRAEKYFGRKIDDCEQRGMWLRDVFELAVKEGRLTPGEGPSGP